MKISFLFILLLCANIVLYAQPIMRCGPVKLDTVENKKALEYEQHANRQAYANSKTMQVFFNILICNDGTLPAATPADIATEFSSLVAAYAPDNICFVNAGYRYIYNTGLDTNFNADINPASLFDPYRVPNCINIFYMQQIKGNNTSCPGGCGYGGITLSVPNTFCLVATGNIGAANTIAHEVGHCFGLRHTFNDGYGAENIDGSNGTTAADQIRDTPADPYDYPKPCNQTPFNGCVYIGTCKDPKGQSNFSPPYTNLMSYWGFCYSNLTLTADQFTRSESFINTNAGLQSCVAANFVTEGPISINSGFRFVSANNMLTTSGGVTITGNSTVTYGGAAVLLNTGFNATPASTGLILIKLKKCY